MEKFKGKYRLKVPYNTITNDFSRKLNGNYEDIDMYIDCQNGNKVFHYGGAVLEAYIPSLVRGHNILKLVRDKVFDILETDSEIIFKFYYKNSDEVIPYLKPKTNGSNISPFSSKNLPQNKEYKIPDEELSVYKEIVANIPQKDVLTITHTTNNYLRTLTSKKHTLDDMKADMKLCGLKGKEYIHHIGKWNDYVKFLGNQLEKNQQKVGDK